MDIIYNILKKNNISLLRPKNLRKIIVFNLGKDYKVEEIGRDITD
jgi:hypothetical protein